MGSNSQNQENYAEMLHCPKNPKVFHQIHETLPKGSKKQMLQEKLAQKFNRNVTNIPHTLVWERSEGEYLISTGRLPCQQIYQRLILKVQF